MNWLGLAQLIKGWRAQVTLLIERELFNTVLLDVVQHSGPLPISQRIDF